MVIGILDYCLDISQNTSLGLGDWINTKSNDSAHGKYQLRWLRMMKNDL